MRQDFRKVGAAGLQAARPGPGRRTRALKCPCTACGAAGRVAKGAWPETFVEGRCRARARRMPGTTAQDIRSGLGVYSRRAVPSRAATPCARTLAVNRSSLRAATVEPGRGPACRRDPRAADPAPEDQETGGPSSRDRPSTWRRQSSTGSNGRFPPAAGKQVPKAPCQARGMNACGIDDHVAGAEDHDPQGVKADGRRRCADRDGSLPPGSPLPGVTTAAEGAPTASAGFATCPNGRGLAGRRGVRPPLHSEHLPDLQVGARLGAWCACRIRKR